MANTSTQDLFRPAFTIRQLTPVDAANYRAIRLAALQNAPEGFGSTYESEAAWPMPGWEERLAAPGAFAGFLDGQIVGMARFVEDAGSP